MLDEAKLRKPDGRFDVPVKLDGVEVYLPKPRVRLGLRMAPDGTRSVAQRTDFGPEFDAELAAYEHSLATPGESTVLAMFALAEAMLRRNYDLTGHDVESLLVFTPEDPESLRTWRAIVATARGEGPKPDGSGSDPDS